MSVYMIGLNRPNEGAWERLKAEWPDRHRVVSDCLAFVAPEKITVTEEIIDHLGMNEEHQVLGIVVEIQYSALNGWNNQPVWEWLVKFQ